MRSHDSQGDRAGTGSDRAGDAVRKAASPAGPATGTVAAELKSRDETIAASQDQAERQEPDAPAGEPEAPVTPSRPHGDDLEEALPEKGPAPTPERPGAEPEDENRVERDLEELAAKAEKADEYLELAQRTKADFENYRRRTARESASAQERGVAKLARELLPAVDNLDRALQAAEAASNGDDGASTLASGIKLVHADVIAALARVGIERFDPAGEPFDPEYHEAVAQQPVEGAPAGTIIEVYQRGYRLGEAVLRPARVVVAG
jgi:molecular chaperone GrpE